MLSADNNAKPGEKKHGQPKDAAAHQPGQADAVNAGAPKAKPEAADGDAPTLAKTESDPKAVSEKLAQLETENADLKDRYLRKYAEFENFKKRMQREREETSKYSNAMLLLDIVNIIDNFERALKAAEDGKDVKNFHSGISLIEKQLVSTLEKKWGLTRFSAKGAAFDPERHEAIMSEQSASAAAATVTEDFQSGYLLHGRVLRPAKVKVVQPLAEAAGAPPPGNEKKEI